MNRITSIEQAEDLLELVEELRQRATPIAKLMSELKGYRYHPDIDEIVITDEGIYANWTTDYCCGESEEDSMHIPLDYLFNDNWIDNAKAQIELEKRRQEEEARKRREREAAAKLERERKEYLKLKEKFG
jgi:hypothetical protein